MWSTNLKAFKCCITSIKLTRLTYSLPFPPSLKVALSQSGCQKLIFAVITGIIERRRREVIIVSCTNMYSTYRAPTVMCTASISSSAQQVFQSDLEAPLRVRLFLPAPAPSFVPPQTNRRKLQSARCVNVPLTVPFLPRWAPKTQ